MQFAQQFAVTAVRQRQLELEDLLALGATQREHAARRDPVDRLGEVIELLRLAAVAVRVDRLGAQDAAAKFFAEAGPCRRLVDDAVGENQQRAFERGFRGRQAVLFGDVGLGQLGEVDVRNGLRIDNGLDLRLFFRNRLGGCFCWSFCRSICRGIRGIGSIAGCCFGGGRLRCGCFWRGCFWCRCLWCRCLRRCRVCNRSICYGCCRCLRNCCCRSIHSWCIGRWRVRRGCLGVGLG